LQYRVTNDSKTISGSTPEATSWVGKCRVVGEWANIVRLTVYMSEWALLPLREEQGGGKKGRHPICLVVEAPNRTLLFLAPSMKRRKDLNRVNILDLAAGREPFT
jgi:hypothetical protein